MTTREEDIRECSLEGCHRVGLYDHITDPNSDAFLDREARELVEASGDACEIGPPYNDVLMAFRQKLRACLEDKGYRTIRIYLQRLCSTKDPGGDPFTWRDFCEWHVTQVRS